MKSATSVLPVWRDATVTVQKAYHEPNGRQQVVVIEGKPRQYGACIKFTPTKGPKAAGAIRNIHIYRNGEGNPAASVIFEDGYSSEESPSSWAPESQVVESQQSADLAGLGLVLQAQAPDAEVILSALWRCRGELPVAFVKAVEEVFAM